MKIKYEKIITNNFKFEINETELAKLKEEAKIERARIKYYQRGNDFTLQNRAEERVYLANDYKTKNDIEKAILLANIVFEKEERFAEMLLNGNFDKRILESFIKLLDYLKSKKANNDLNETDLQYEKKCEALATKLVKQSHLQ